MANQWIEIEHANQNNLKDISVAIPKHKMTVFTG
ncbi:MAG: Excinuclease ATPase subunit, partial [Leuconostoc sp. DORA_2]